MKYHGSKGNSLRGPAPSTRPTVCLVDLALAECSPETTVGRRVRIQVLEPRNPWRWVQFLHSRCCCFFKLGWACFWLVIHPASSLFSVVATFSLPPRTFLLLPIYHRFSLHIVATALFLHPIFLPKCRCDPLHNNLLIRSVPDHRHGREATSEASGASAHHSQSGQWRGYA